MPAWVSRSTNCSVSKVVVLIMTYFHVRGEFCQVLVTNKKATPKGGFSIPKNQFLV